VSDTRFAPVDAPEREAATEPPVLWRNKWWNPERRHAINDWGGVDLIDAGVVWSSGVFPSKQEAEADARIKARFNEMSGAPMRWLGAFPDGEAP